MRALWEAIPQRSRGGYAETSTELVQELMRTLCAGDVVLIKGSFGSRMSVIIDALKAWEAVKA
jgi:UDP-N-acetylmuramoyl-tripeptide--D-alanyl-D-alanine ligase